MKTKNEYQKLIDTEVYEKIPKAVLAAIAVSAFSDGGANLKGMTGAILWEWDCLFQNGIVPQKPFKAKKNFILEYKLGLLK